MIKSEERQFAEKREIVFLVFHTNASKVSCERRRHFTDKYMRNKNLNIQLSLYAVAKWPAAGQGFKITKWLAVRYFSQI